jgi:hypothetical protein
MFWQIVANFVCMRSSLLESVVAIEFQATEAYSSIDFTTENKAQIKVYGGKRKCDFTNYPYPFHYMRKKSNQHDDENNFYS